MTERETGYKRLQPILYVNDLEAEKRFYSQLGFTVKDEMPNFASVRHGEHILFGLLLKKDFRLVNFNQQLVWQVYELCQQEGLRIEELPVLEDWGEWTVAVSSPNGWMVVFEGGE